MVTTVRLRSGGAPLALVELADAEERDAAGSIAGSGHASFSNASPARPRAAAKGMPWTFPLGLVSGVLMSAWASIQRTPPGP
jgi:hypothetical protein